jgi:hypothetical protein
MCRGVSSPALHRHWTDSIPGTLQLYKNFASPIRPVRACTSTEFSAFWSPEWSSSTALFGGVASGIAWLLLGVPGSVPGCTTCSSFLCSVSHRAVQSASTFCFSRSSHCSMGRPVHFLPTVSVCSLGSLELVAVAAADAACGYGAVSELLCKRL